MNVETAALLRPTKLWTRTEILARPCPVPASAGVYAWFFDPSPQVVPTDGLVRSAGLALLYVGISPKPPSAIGTPSRQTLRSRIRYHFRGNAEGSTLRLSLGCLLSQSLGIELRRVGSGQRMSFAAGERVLSDWLEQNARVAWLACDEPWRIEEQMIRSISLPLNLDQNRHHGFHSLPFGDTACGESASKRAAGCLFGGEKLMTHFTLSERSVGKLLTTFHVLDSSGNVVGSINVQNAQVPDLLMHWVLPADRGERQPPVANAKLQSRSPIGRMSRAMVLRGC